VSVRRFVARALLIVGAGALVMAYLQHRRTPTSAENEVAETSDSAVQFEVLERRPLAEGGMERRVELSNPFADPPRAPLPDAEPTGRRYHVSPRGDDAAEGSPKQPWRSLDHALCRLEPGDRLTIGAGTYVGPFAIDGDCHDGTAERPIEVYANDDATLVGAKGSAEPVLTIARQYWTLAGLEVSAGPIDGPLIRIAGARHVIVNAAHVVGSAGDGIEIGPGSEDIEIHDSHLHQLGAGGAPVSSRQRGGNAARRPEGRVIAVRILPGTRVIRITGTNIHNVWGEPIHVVTPEEHLAAGGERLAAAADLEIDTRQFQTGQDEW
jgi:hypothetical protein